MGFRLLLPMARFRAVTQVGLLPKRNAATRRGTKVVAAIFSHHGRFASESSGGCGFMQRLPRVQAAILDGAGATGRGLSNGYTPAVTRRQ